MGAEKVFFDRNCGFCRFWKDTAEMESPDAFLFIPLITGSDSSMYPESIALELPSGQRLYGMAAVRRIVLKVPIMFPLLVPLAVSRILGIDSILYMFISKNRNLLSRIMHLDRI
ncbi:MAG: DUF393 domain-containing protein [Candidatus Thermoplasmatota archaeon]|nr:DUF393 domain-containing protein [Candidatus Thermoplasmatota archaeon]